MILQYFNHLTDMKNPVLLCELLHLLVMGLGRGVIKLDFCQHVFGHGAFGDFTVLFAIMSFDKRVQVIYDTIVIVMVLKIATAKGKRRNTS